MIGYSIKQAADLLGITPSALAARIERGKAPRRIDDSGHLYLTGEDVDAMPRGNQRPGRKANKQKARG